MVDNKIKRDIVEVKTDRKKDIDKYLEELKTIIDDDDNDNVIISDTLSDLRELIKETYEVLSTIEDMCDVKQLSKDKIKLIETIFKKYATQIQEYLKMEIANNLIYDQEQAVNNVLVVLVMSCKA